MKKLILLLLLVPNLYADCEITQGTTGFVNVGPFHDDTDFKTLKNALTITKADVRLSKNAAAFAAANSNQSVDGVADTGAPLNENGIYRIRYNTTDSDTIGNLGFAIKESGALIAWRDCIVRGPTAAEHALSSVASLLDNSNFDCANNTNPNSAAGRVCSDKFDRADARGTADSGTTTSLVDTERSEADSSLAERAYIVFTSGTNIRQSAMITGYSASTNTLTFSPLTSAVAAGDTYEIRSLPSFLRPTVAGRTLVVSAAGAADSNLTHVAGTAQTPGNIIGDTDDIQQKIGTPAVSLATDIAAVKVDTGAVKLKTDFLPSTAAGSAGGLFIAGTNGDTTVNFIGNLSGNVSGSVGSIATGGINALSFSVNSIKAAAIDPDASIEFATTLLATQYEGAETFKNFLRYTSSALFGRYSTSGSTYNFRDLANSKTRISYGTTTVPPARTTVTLDATD